MTFQMLAVCEVGEEGDRPVYPILDPEINVEREPIDGDFGIPLQVSTVIVSRKVGNTWQKQMETSDISFQLWVTGGRVIAYCRKFEKGGGWVGFGLGGLAVAAVGNIVSHAVAANRRKGKALVGHLRYPWISEVAFAPKQGFGSAETLRLTYVDGSEPTKPEVHVTFHLDRGTDANQVARYIVDRIIAYRYASGEKMTADEVAAFEKLRGSGFLPPPQKGYLSIYHIPTSWNAPSGLTHVPSVTPAFPPGSPPAGIVEETPAPEATPEPMVEVRATPDLLPVTNCAACGSIYVGRSFCTDCGAPVAAG